MELPKNIVWIGNPDRVHKIYVEDYVVSYIKQLNKELYGSRAGLALYGKRCEENNEKYYFLYGAAHILGLEGKGQYLSEIEKEAALEMGERYFKEYDFVAWCSLEGDLPDGFYLYEMGKGLYIDGYACFYEKNEGMLNFMLSLRKAPEEEKTQFQSRLESVRSENIRQKEEREIRPVPRKKNNSVSHMRTAVAGVAVVLCLMAIPAISGSDKLTALKAVARNVIDHMGEQKLPDKESSTTGSGSLDGQEKEQGKTTQTPPTSGQNSQMGESGQQPDSQMVQPGNQAQSGTQTPQTGAEQTGDQTPQAGQAETGNQISQAGQAQTGDQISQAGQAQGQQVQPGSQTTQAQPGTQLDMQQDVQSLMEQENEKSKLDAVQTEQKTVSYVVAKGDTLLSISKQKYGSVSRVKEICSLNGIVDADSIQAGQIILLPQ